MSNGTDPLFGPYHPLIFFFFFFIIVRQSYRTWFPSLFFINSMPSYMWLLATLFEADFLKIKMGLLNWWLVLTSGAEWFIYGQMTTGFFSWPVTCSQAHCRPLGSSCHHHPRRRVVGGGHGPWWKLITKFFCLLLPYIVTPPTLTEAAFHIFPVAIIMPLITPRLARALH